MEQFLFSLLYCWHWPWSRISSFTNFFCSLSFSYFLYFGHYLKNLKISIPILSFMDNCLSIAQHKSISVSNVNLYCSYNVISTLFTRFILVVEYGKTEVFHFSRLYGVFNPPPLDLIPLRGFVLLPKIIWEYLGFFFN